MHFGAVVDNLEGVDLAALLVTLYEWGGQDPFILSTTQIGNSFGIDEAQFDYVDNYVKGMPKPYPWNLFLAWHNNRAGDVPTQCLFHEYTSMGRIMGIKGAARLVIFLGSETQYHSILYPNPFDTIEHMEPLRVPKSSSPVVARLPWKHGGSLTLHASGVVVAEGGAPNLGYHSGPCKAIRYRPATGPGHVPGYQEGYTIYGDDNSTYEF